MKNRDVTRVIVAPSGYGKTFAALEYAETIHSWKHVFWLNAQSPCFARDLDAGEIVSGCLSIDPDAALVVFDDVPFLEASRQERLSSEIDRLLAEGCEVIVTCVPSCGFNRELQRDMLRLGAEDLLLNDAELDDVRFASETMRVASSQLEPSARIPALVWPRAEGAAESFVKGLFEEELPFDLRLVMYSALVLGRGAIADLSAFGPLDESLVSTLSHDYPHLGFDEDQEGFSAVSLEIDVLAPLLKKCLPQLAERSSFASSDELACAWASTLLKCGQPERACAVMREICPRRSRAQWTLAHATELVRQACFFPALQLTRGKLAGKGSAALMMDAFEALCRRLLGDEEGAIRCAKRSAFNQAAPEGARVLSLLILSRLDAGLIAQRAHDVLSLEIPPLASVEVGECSSWMALARARNAASCGLQELSCFWMELADNRADADVLCIGASWMFRLHDGSEAEFSPEVCQARARAVRYVMDRLLECVEQGVFDFFVTSAGLSLEEARARGMLLEEGPLESSSLILLRKTEMRMFSQRRLFDEAMRNEQARRSDWVVTHPASLLAHEAVLPAKVSERSVPVLTLRMFGRFEVEIGDAPVEAKQFRRRNVRMLLALLAVNQGRELSRDAASGALWPKSSNAAAQKNFYSVWAHLRSALSLQDGTCPYLVRHRYGCSLDSRFVQSDIDRFGEICRELLFGAPDIEQWALLFSEIDRDFASDLMPSEKKNALIVQTREDYRTRLVDALVAATASVIDVGNPRWGVCFARAAIGRDETREDAYVALMRAQIAGNQRTAAMMTYLNCRKALSDHLGIDPAPETTALYESLLEGD